MAAVQTYQESAGCGASWCYHAFPSYFVWLRRQHQQQERAQLRDQANTTSWNISNQLVLSHRTGRVLDDFELRDPEIDWEWSKSITRTKYAFMGGLHQTGSCRFTTSNNGNGKFVSRNDVAWYDEPYEETTIGMNKTKQQKAKKNKCHNLMMEGFGMIHHFYSLNRIRHLEHTSFQESCMGEGTKDSKEDDDDASSSKEDDQPCVGDEYVSRFGQTVHAQLEARKRRLDDH